MGSTNRLFPKIAIKYYFQKWHLQTHQLASSSSIYRKSKCGNVKITFASQFMLFLSVVLSGFVEIHCATLFFGGNH